MDSSKEGKRQIIWYMWKKGKTGSYILREMQDIFGDECPSNATIYRWIERFDNGDEELHDDTVPGRRTSSKPTRKTFGSYSNGGWNLLHHYEPESKTQSKQWKKRAKPVSIKVEAAKSAGKRMATVFCDRGGNIHFDWLPEETTINSDYYVDELKELRQVIKRERQGKLTVAYCCNMTTQGSKDQNPTQSSIYKWYRQSRLGHTSLDDESRPGRPITAVTEENIDKVSELVTEDWQITVRQIAFEVSVSSETIETILHQHLGLKRFCSKLILSIYAAKVFQKDSRRWSEVITGDETWIYYYDIQSKQQSSKWIFEDEQPDSIPKQPRAVDKRMFAVFFSTRGIIEYVMLPEKHTVTATWYTEIVFRKCSKLSRGCVQRLVFAE
ncbi:Transposase [Oopsacas minuta]|uniref:Transposase n=1 Tax=Oopsacas minuta TaxID=111878 RepID=A0AAV7KBY9_9METZ|nr:Transposase [Oopsacas minuta]